VGKEVGGVEGALLGVVEGDDDGMNEGSVPKKVG